MVCKSGLYAGENGKIEMYNITVKNCGNSGLMTNMGDIIMYSGTVTDNASASDIGGGVRIRGGSFTLYGGIISKNRADKQGGGVSIEDNGSFTMHGGTIKENLSNSLGGGVSVYVGSFVMRGGTITDNKTFLQGGGVYLFDGSFDMYDGTISNNIAKYSWGGGIYSENAELSISGGTIKDNNAKDYGGGIFITTASTVEISGAPVITDNTVGESPDKIKSNIHLQHNGSTQAILKIGTMTEGAKVGITLYEEGVFSEGGTTQMQYFFSDSNAWQMTIDGENLRMSKIFVKVGTVKLADGSYTKNGSSTAFGTPTGTGYAYLKDGVLTLNNFTYSASDEVTAITSDYRIRIEVVGENTLSSTNKATITFLNYGCEIFGDGTLKLTSASGNGLTSYSNKHDGMQTVIRDITLNIDASGNGIAAGDLVIENATVNIKAGSTGIASSSKFTGSAINIDAAGFGISGSNGYSFDDCVVYIKSGSTALTTNANGKIHIGSGKYILNSDNTNGAIYITDATLTLPTSISQWRTDPNGKYSVSVFEYNKEQYIEINTAYLDELIEGFNKELDNLEAKNTELTEALDAAIADIAAKNAELDAKDASLDAKNAELDAKNAELDAKDGELAAKDGELIAKDNELASAIAAASLRADADKAAFEGANAELAKQNAELAKQNTELDGRLEATKAELNETISAGDNAKANATAAYVLLAVVGVIALAGNAGWIIPLIKKKD